MNYIIRTRGCDPREETRYPDKATLFLKGDDPPTAYWIGPSENDEDVIVTFWERVDVLEAHGDLFVSKANP